MSLGKRTNEDTQTEHAHRSQKLQRLFAAPLHDGKVVGKVANPAIDIYFKNLNGFNLPESFLLNSQHKPMSILKEYLTEWKNVKVNLLLECTFYKIRIHDGALENQVVAEEMTDANFKTKNEELALTSDFKEIINELDYFELKGSGWMLKSVDGILIRITKYTPLSGKCFYPTNAHLRKSKSIINVQNEDNHCFKYAILS
uniref:Isoleucine--tRNA ligase n=1 Tax=Lygus hesperus TaxID=30085 RepID=A0A0A9YHL7_LYGHE